MYVALFVFRETPIKALAVVLLCLIVHVSNVVEIITQAHHMHVYTYQLYFDRPKHPPKVHVWAGISLCGPTKICIFDGIMDAPLFVDILDSTLVPFITEKYAGGHRFMQDNDPPSILLYTRSLSMRGKELIGGGHLQNHLTSIL